LAVSFPNLEDGERAVRGDQPEHLVNEVTIKHFKTNFHKITYDIQDRSINLDFFDVINILPPL
jgi:hypothetical protein